MACLAGIRVGGWRGAEEWRPSTVGDVGVEATPLPRKAARDSLACSGPGCYRCHRRRTRRTTRHPYVDLLVPGVDGPGLVPQGPDLAQRRVRHLTGHCLPRQAIAVLAAQAQDLHTARRVAADGWSHVILDGKLFDCDHLAETTLSVKGETIDAWYSDKHRDFGANIQVIMRPDGLPLWTSEATPGTCTTPPAPASSAPPRH